MEILEAIPIDKKGKDLKRPNNTDVDYDGAFHNDYLVKSLKKKKESKNSTKNPTKNPTKKAKRN